MLNKVPSLELCQLLDRGRPVGLRTWHKSDIGLRTWLFLVVGRSALVGQMQMSQIRRQINVILHT